MEHWLSNGHDSQACVTSSWGAMMANNCLLKPEEVSVANV
jgi:hypothetical protein